MADLDVDVEQQLAALTGGDAEGLDILGRLAEAIFPGRVGLGEASRLTWPEQAHSDNGALRLASHGDPDPGELEAHIRRSEARFRSLVEQLPAVVFYAALGAGDNEIYVSPQIESLLGFTQREWLDNPLLWYSQLHPDDHDIVIEAFTRGVQTGMPFRAEVRFFSRQGEAVWILGEARLIRDELGRPAYFQGVAFDVTITKRAQSEIAEAERMKAEAAQQRADQIASHNARLRNLNRELKAAKDAAEAAVHARTTFLTTMSHELRTPLNSIIVLSGLLADGELTEAQYDMVRRMRLSSDHLLELINDVLEFSRLRAGGVQLDCRPFDVEAWLDDSLEIIAPRAATQGLELRRRVADGIPRVVRSDQGRLRQVLLNLLGNAVKFTAAGYVSVELDATELEAGRWEFHCAVRDSGMGIKAADAANLFDEFRQADTGIAREFGGTGLGLAICKRLCELLGGHIWVEQVGGPGATMVFTFQAEAVPAAGVVAATTGTPVPAGPTPGPFSGPERDNRPAEPKARRPATPRSDLRVLVAEDNLMNQQVATLLLTAMGHASDVVSNGDEAIAAVRARPYDVVLMDIAMPGTDGMTAARAIRALGSEVHQPYIVALTAHAFPGDSEACLAAGMDDYVAKPIDRAELARALAAGAERRRAGAPVEQHPPAAGVIEAPAAAFDPSVTTALLAEFGLAPLRRLVAVFRAEATRLVTLIAASAAAGDAAGVQRDAHTLKSSAANLGALALQASCAELEARSRHGSLAGAEALAESMRDQLAGALGQLDRLVGPA